MSLRKSFDQSHPQSQSWSINGKNESPDEDDDMSVLDGKILDADTPHYPISADLGSIANDHFHSMDPSQASMWFDHPSHQVHSVMEQETQDSIPMSGHPPIDLADMDHHPTTFFAGSHAAWTSVNGSGTCTPTQMYTPAQQDFDEAIIAHGPTGSLFDQPRTQRPQGFGMSTSIPMSPQSSQGWMSATSSDAADAQAGPVRSPTLQPVSPLSVQRRDGVRKKNARFEIPKDRNLNTIDHLIKLYTDRGDDSQLKELKQQKRLLRNRQAALDSRQRKKQHTEDLEREKARTDGYIKEIEEELESYKLSVNEFMQAQARLQEQQRQMHEYITNLQMQRDEIIRTSTLEAENLRRQNNILRERAQQLERERDALQSNHVQGFTNFENMPLDGSTDWNDYSMPTVGKVDHDTGLSSQRPAFPVTQPNPVKSEPFNQSKNDYPFSWNTFYMCLLFGAFIASNTGSSSSASSSKTTQSSVTIPSLSEEYRSESANVLKAVLASAPNTLNALPSNQPGTMSSSDISRRMSHPPSTSAASSATLNDFHNSLTTLNRNQEEIQAFSLTAEQYASITGLDSQDFSHQSSPPSSSFPMPSQQPPQAKGPTPLQRAFASLRASQDAVDRQLMPRGPWERSAVADATAAMNSNHPGFSWEEAVAHNGVPEKVVRDFRKMVEESQHGGSGTVVEVMDATDS